MLRHRAGRRLSSVRSTKQRTGHHGCDVAAHPAASGEARGQLRSLTCFAAKRNPFLAKFIPDRVENTVDALLPDKVERVLNRGASKVHGE